MAVELPGDGDWTAERKRAERALHVEGRLQAGKRGPGRPKKGLETRVHVHPRVEPATLREISHIGTAAQVLEAIARMIRATRSGAERAVVHAMIDELLACAERSGD